MFLGDFDRVGAARSPSLRQIRRRHRIEGKVVPLWRLLSGLKNLPELTSAASAKCRVGASLGPPTPPSAEPPTQPPISAHSSAIGAIIRTNGGGEDVFSPASKPAPLPLTRLALPAVLIGRSAYQPCGMLRQRETYLRDVEDGLDEA